MSNFKPYFTVNENGCYVWRRTTHDGYPENSLHRKVCAIFHGLPENHHAHHKCNNPSCVNPDHLEPLICEDNNDLRSATKIRHKERPMIRKRIADGERVLDIAKEYGVTAERIYQIKNEADLVSSSGS